MDELLAALKTSNQRLAGIVGGLTEEQASGPSYDDDWTIAQVASHLGSGAEIFDAFVRAGATGSEPPGMEQFQAAWDVWNAKSPAEQIRDVVTADAALAATFESMTPEQRNDWRLEMFHEQRSLASVLGMRLSEHALHTWDIEVMADPAATVAADATGLVLDQLAPLISRAAQPRDEPIEIDVTTTDPGRELRLSLGVDGATLGPQPGDSTGDATMSIPAEAFVRLAYGRLDPDHTPDGIVADGIDLDTLRQVFPGF